MQNFEKKLLILDLDETLYAAEKKLEREHDFIVGQYFVYERPFLGEFLAFCFQNFEVAVWLNQIKKPTLSIWGEQDGLLKLADGERFNREIANSQFIVFDQCGHVPQVEKAADFNAAVLKFLEGK